MLNPKSDLHDVVPTSDSSALEHVASNVASNVGTAIPAPAPALEAPAAEEVSLPLFLKQAAAQVVAAHSVAGTTASQDIFTTPAATTLAPEHYAAEEPVTATAADVVTTNAANAVAATSDTVIADNASALEASVTSTAEVITSDTATAATAVATTSDAVIADNASEVEASIAANAEVMTFDPATVIASEANTTTATTATFVATTSDATIMDSASEVEASATSTAEIATSDTATASDTTTTTSSSSEANTSKKGKRSSRAKKPRQPKRAHFLPEPMTNTSEQILSQPQALKQCQLMQVLASADEGAIQTLLTPQQLAAFSNSHSSAERLEQENKILGVLLRHRGEDKIFLDTLMQESGMSCEAVAAVMRKLRALEIIRMYSTFVRFYDLESADVYLSTVVRTNKQRKSYSVKYPQDDIENDILSRDEAFGFYLLKSRKAISFADYTVVVAKACTDLGPIQELLVLLYRCGKVQLKDNVLYFVPKKRIPRKAKSSPTSQGSPAGGQGLAPNGAVASDGATTPVPAASASGASAESKDPVESKAPVEAMTTSTGPVDAASVAVTVDASVEDTAAVPAEVASGAVNTATVSESSRLEPVVAVSEVANTSTSLAAHGSEQIAAGVTAPAVSAVSAAIPAVPSNGAIAAPVTAKATALADSCHEHLRPSALATAIASMVTSFGGCSTKPQDGSCVL